MLGVCGSGMRCSSRGEKYSGWFSNTYCTREIAELRVKLCKNVPFLLYTWSKCLSVWKRLSKYIVNLSLHSQPSLMSTFFCLGLTFEISEGGFLDIDVRIVGPDGKVIYQGERETSGKYTFAAHLPGKYTYCFSNQMSTMTPKVVMFDMEVGDAPKADPKVEDKDSAGKHCHFRSLLCFSIYIYLHLSGNHGTLVCYCISLRRCKQGPMSLMQI